MHFTQRKNIIPKETAEQERLKRLLNTKDLTKLSPLALKPHIKMKTKTPSDYYKDSSIPLLEKEKRLEELFGAKTDFSIANFKNNYKKLNKEQKEVLIFKMQSEFNKLGLKDKSGKPLKTDGIFGKKTKWVYHKFIKSQ